MGRRTLIAIPAGLLAAGLAAFAQAPSATKADTIDNTGGALAGQPMAGLIVAGKPCSFGDTYHYQITGRGELRGEGPITCPSASIIAGKVNGNELLCRLDAKLHCTARPPGIAAPLHFAVDDNGVTVGGTTYRWADQPKAAALLPQIRQHAEARTGE